MIDNEERDLFKITSKHFLSELEHKIVNPLSSTTGGSGQKTGGSNLSSLIGAGLNIYSAMNARDPQSPELAQAGASPWSKYAGDAAQQLNALNNNPNLV